MIHVGITLGLFKTFHISKTVCPYIAKCYYRLCTNTADSQCEYCHNEVKDKLYWRGYTRHYDGQMKQCRSKYPTVTPLTDFRFLIRWKNIILHVCTKD